MSACKLNFRRLRHGAVYDGAVTVIPRRAHRRCCQRRTKATEMDISDWRQKIDELDEQIVQLISKRAQAAKAIGELKRNSNLPVYEPGREQAVFDHIRRVNPGQLPDNEMLHIYERIIDVMRTLQRRDQ
jgi:chorismate mutase